MKGWDGDNRRPTARLNRQDPRIIILAIRDQLRRAMATFKHTGGVSKFGAKLIAGMVKNGYTQEFAAKTFKGIPG